MTTLCAFALVIHYASLPRYIPYVVEVDKLGESVAVKPADAAALADDRVVRFSVGSFINDARMVTPDLDLEKAAVLRVGHEVNQKDPAFQTITGDWWAGDKDPFRRAEKETVDVEDLSVSKLAENAWQVDWTEKVTNRDNTVKDGPYRMRCTLNTYVIPWSNGATEAQLNRNAFGVYIERIVSCNRLP